MSTLIPSASTATTRDHTVVARNLRFHYREWGDAAAPVALLLHGLTGNAWEWDPVASALSEQFRVVALNQRGHGATAWAGTYVADAMVADLYELVDILDLGRPTVIGHSMGGIHASVLAAEHPDLVDRLVMVDIGPDSLVELSDGAHDLTVEQPTALTLAVQTFLS